MVDEIRARFVRLAPELREPLVIGGASAMIVRHPRVLIEGDSHRDQTRIGIEVPLDYAMLLTGGEQYDAALIDMITEALRVKLDGLRRAEQ